MTKRMLQVLVVDDDEISRDLIEHTLSSAGYNVRTAADGREALELLRSGQYRLIISDWDMPNVSGVELCRTMRGADIEGYVYMILLTGNAGPAEIVEGMTAGADDFIAKPFNPSELVVRVRAGEPHSEPGNSRHGHLRAGQTRRIARSGDRPPFGTRAALLAHLWLSTWPGCRSTAT
ncbi:MAG: response regulator [Pirellulales bacterium]